MRSSEVATELHYDHGQLLGAYDTARLGEVILALVVVVWSRRLSASMILRVRLILTQSYIDVAGLGVASTAIIPRRYDYPMTIALPVNALTTYAIHVQGPICCRYTGSSFIYHVFQLDECVMLLLSQVFRSTICCTSAILLDSFLFVAPVAMLVRDIAHSSCLDLI